MAEEETKNAETECRLPDPRKLVVSSSPHYHSGEDIRKIMITVILTLLPACLAGVIFFGWQALWVLVVCSISCMAIEAGCCRLQGRPSTLGDFSALLTGILLGMNLSPLTPWWVCVIGSLLAIGLAKQIYGGLGFNPFNPALVGRVGLIIAFPAILTTWAPTRFMHTDAITTATPLGQWQTNGVIGHAYWDYFIGNVGGCIGETSALALLIGGVILIARRLIRWEVPVFYIGTVLVFTGIVYLLSPDKQAPPLFHLLTGGLFLGAFFMATDMVTSPMGRLGAIIFGIGCGIVTCVIRIWGSYPEGVSFSILFMNALVPLIDRLTVPRPFGTVKKPQEAK